MHFGFWCWVDNNSLTNTIYQKKKKKKKKSVHCMQCTMHPKWQCECDTQLVFSLCAPNNLLDQTKNIYLTRSKTKSAKEQNEAAHCCVLLHCSGYVVFIICLLSSTLPFNMFPYLYGEAFSSAISFYRDRSNMFLSIFISLCSISRYSQAYAFITFSRVLWIISVCCSC